MNKKLCVIFLVLALLLSGCQLAKPEVEGQPEKDILVGVMLTEEYLDLFDWESFLQNNFNQLDDGMISEQESVKYSDRIWAEADGKGGYVFPNVEGILFVSYLVSPDGSKENAYWSGEAQNGICEVSFGHHSGDNSQELNLSGTVYFSNTHPHPCLYFNPVYQTADGKLYLVAGQGTSFDGALASTATTTLKEEVTRTENGEESTHKTLVTVTMEGVYPAHSLVVLQMDAENHVLKAITLNPDETIPELNIDASCAYILLEEHTSDGIRRSLYEKDSNALYFFRELENKLSTKARINLVWPE